MGEKWLKKKQSPWISWTLFLSKLEKTESKKFLHSVIFWTTSAPCQTTKNDKFSLYLFLTFSSTRVLETHLVLGGLKAACIGPALSKFCLSVGDGATCLTSSCPLGPLLFRDILFSVVSFPLALEADNWLCWRMGVWPREVLLQAHVTSQ